VIVQVRRLVVQPGQEPHVDETVRMQPRVEAVSEIEANDALPRCRVRRVVEGEGSGREAAGAATARAGMPTTVDCDPSGPVTGQLHAASMRLAWPIVNQTS
jgi:hypothetical protein